MRNIFNQFDQFENVQINNSKNKYLFDFAHSAANYGGTVSDAVNAVWIIKNKINSYSNMTAVNGVNKTVTLGNPVVYNEYGPIYLGTTTGSLVANVTPLISSLSSEYDNSNYNLVPKMQENTLICLKGRYTSGSNATSFFRSGYIELSFKTDKQNCIIGYGSSVIDLFASSNLGSTSRDSTGSLTKTIQTPEIVNTSGTQYSTDTDLSNVNELSINIKNGKLNLLYNDAYGINSQSFEITSNLNVADNQWHHVVINFTRPGLIKNHKDLHENKAIEIWIDGKLDKTVSDYVNDDQIFFPEITWLGADPILLFNSQFTNSIYDGFSEQDKLLFGDGLSTVNIWNGSWSTSATENAFNGLIRTFASGLNIPLSKFEIQERYKFWNYDEMPFRDSMIASAELINPTVSVNKKRALKLFWNNIPNKNGISLDNNFIVDSYSITHQNKNSITETHNLDLAKKKEFNILTNIRVALKDNVLIWNPGNVRDSSTTTSTTQNNPNKISNYSGFAGSFINMTFSGVELNNGDRILLTNQINKSENGIWVFNGKTNPLTRPNDADSPTKINNAIVYITEGDYSETYWVLENNITSFNELQKWVKLESKPDTTIYSQPFLTNRWSDSIGNPRFINLETDLNIGNYDVIVFMNYPETLTEIKEQFPEDNVIDMYKKFILSVKNVVIAGASLYVSSPMLALDLGIVRKFIEIPQLTENTDAQSAAINPFQIGESSDKYFDTHRNNQYQLATSITGLTNISTYVLTDFINYIPNDAHDYEQYHAKYLQKAAGLQEGNTWFIPGLALTKFTENENLPGNRNNYRGTKPLLGVDSEFDILSGTMVTKFANNYYNGSTVTANPYDDYATTIVVQPNQTLGGTGITGKVFVNVIEDGYTFSREDYNKAMIQVLPQTDINETTNTRLWQYSTNRLNRTPHRINISALTENGQTVPTIGGGGGFIQAASNASSGIIRSESDKDNADYQSDYYPKLEEEIYSLQEIPVYSMTWLGLKWLAE